MESYTLNEIENYEDVLGGPFLIELVHMMKLPIPEIKVTKRKYGFWGVRTKHFGRKEDPKTEDINYGTLTHDSDMGMNTAVHDAIAHLSYHHRVELGTHYLGRLGWQKPKGAHIILTDEQKVKFSPVLVYNQELEHYIKNLQMDLLSELFENGALRESLKIEKLKVANVKKHDPEIQKLRQDLKIVKPWHMLVMLKSRSSRANSSNYKDDIENSASIGNICQKNLRRSSLTIRSPLMMKT
ncbi:hypothetical protein D1007_00506 [Hordeum vulgare]|nr:hypothetical protein D1007_00506 [Hordeum vulgare]